MWLVRRLAVAGRAAELLDRKRQALISETERMQVLSARARKDWDSAMAGTRTWAVRASLLAGEEQLTMLAAQLGAPAAAQVSWRSIMGVAYPAQVDLRMPEHGSAALAGTAAYDQLEGSARVSLQAALEHAASARAYSVLSQELANTARRQRLIAKRRIPELSEELRRLQLRLDEQERDEGVRARWVARRQARVGRAGW